MLRVAGAYTDGTIATWKVPSTPDDYGRAVVDGLCALLDKVGVPRAAASVAFIAGVTTLVLRKNPDAPSAVVQIVSKAIEKDREMRYLTAAEMRRDLKRLNRDSASTPAVQRPARTRSGIQSLAVLPLVNASGDADAEYLSEGIAESLIDYLSQLPNLRVVQPQKSSRYRGADVDLGEPSLAQRPRRAGHQGLAVEQREGQRAAVGLQHHAEGGVLLGVPALRALPALTVSHGPDATRHPRGANA